MTTSALFTAADLSFDAASHEYRLPTGARVLSVTQVLKLAGASTDFDAISAMSEWRAAAIGFRRDLGVAVHADCHSWDDEDLEWGNVDPHVLPFVEAWTVVRANFGLQPMTRERRVYHAEDDYCGTLDGLFLTGAGKVVLADLKIGNPDDAAADLQTAAYEAAYLVEHPDARIDERWSIQLCPKLRIPYRITNYTARPGAWEDFPRFRSCLAKIRQQEARPMSVAPVTEFAIEPEPAVEEFALEPETDGPAVVVAELPAPSNALMQVLPADFPLPALIRFVPNTALKIAAEEATRYALAIEVKGTEQVQRADVALTALRTSLKAIEAEFAEPTETANALHKRLTGLRSEWTAAGASAVKTVGSRIYTEQTRLNAIEQEERRRAQEEANRLAREQAAAEAAAAEKAKAPAPVVQELKRQAETAQAAPVGSYGGSSGSLKGSALAKRWTTTIAGTPREAEQNPDMADLSEAQRAKVLDLMRAVLDGKAPLVCFELGWGYLNRRAKADESALAIPGIEAYDAGGVRAKATRSK